jgi:uracil-DNA glycosylase family 4
MKNITFNKYPFFFIDQKPPKKVKKNVYIEGKIHFAGVGNLDSDIVFVAPTPLREDELNDDSPPGLLKGDVGAIFRRLCSRAGLGNVEKTCYFTTISKYSVPDGEKRALKKEELNWSEPWLDSELKEIKPKVIVCLGRHVFNYFHDLIVESKSDNKKGVKISVGFDDALGAFFRCNKYNCVIYCMDKITNPRYQPHQIARFVLDLKQVKKFQESIDGGDPEIIKQDYLVVDDIDKLSSLFAMFRALNIDMLSVDCEWGGRTYLDGKLRSIQFCWAPGKAAYIKFYDQRGDWCFGTTTWSDLRDLFQELKDMRWIGHNVCADFVWMEHVLGLNTYQKCIFDTMYAESVIDEYADQKLERLALKYTDLGRYDVELSIWKKINKSARAKKLLADDDEDEAQIFETNEDEGYASVPDDILIPYACKDVDTVFRAYPILKEKLRKCEIESYYYGILLPFVSDAFTSMIMTGLPIDKDYLVKLGSDFEQVFHQLQIDIRERMVVQAKRILFECLWQNVTGEEEVTELYNNVIRLFETDEVNNFKEAWTCVKQSVGPNAAPEAKEVLEHLWISPSFNIRSNIHMVRWLYCALKLNPIKTTKGANGMSISWDKVLDLPKEQQSNYKPAADKQTLQILEYEDPLVSRVLQLNSVGNLIKGFLAKKGSSSKNALINWIQSDGKLHCNYSCTETGRPRSWKPNVLNYPKRVTKWIQDAFEEMDLGSPGSVRSCTYAGADWCFVDADLDTAEVVSLAFISGDEGMIEMCRAEDAQFLLVDAAKAKKLDIPVFLSKGIAMVRVQWINDYTSITSESMASMPLCDDYSKILLNGEKMSPVRDMHWEMAEAMQNKPRELLDEDLDRGAGKVGMFSIPYGAQSHLLEREIETLTGVKPEEGIGLKLIEAYKQKFPKANAFLEKQELIVENPGYYRTISGRVRHFHVNLISEDITSGWGKKSLISPLTRESRNYPMQEMVAATMMRAQVSLLNAFIDAGMKARPMIMLYDALVVHCPEDERWQVDDMMKEHLSVKTFWMVHNRKLNFTIDSNFSKRWGAKLTKEEHKRLYAK